MRAYVWVDGDLCACTGSDIHDCVLPTLSLVCMFTCHPDASQFLAYGDVTAIAMGPGVFPWSDGTKSAEDEWTTPEATGLQPFKCHRDEPLPRCGDGAGHIGESNIVALLAVVGIAGECVVYSYRTCSSAYL